MTLTLGGKGRKFRKIERLVPNVQFGACDLSAWSWGAPCSWQAPAQSSVAAGDRKANLLTSKCAHAEQTCCSRPPITTAASPASSVQAKAPLHPTCSPNTPERSTCPNSDSRHNRLPPTDPPPASSPATQASSKALFHPQQLTKRRFRAYLVVSNSL